MDNWGGLSLKKTFEFVIKLLFESLGLERNLSGKCRTEIHMYALANYSWKNYCFFAGFSQLEEEKVTFIYSQLYPSHFQDLASNSFYTVCHIFLLVLILRNYCWTNKYSHSWYSSFFFSQIVCLIMNWYCKEKWCPSHWWEWKGSR